jgi:hypothetical protein
MISIEVMFLSEGYTFTIESKFLLISVAPIILTPLRVPFLSITGGFPIGLQLR